MQIDPSANKAGHERQPLHYLIGSDFRLILWSEIKVAYVEDLLKRLEETSYCLTPCFLNGLFSAVKNQHVREIKCVAAGDPYCEWEVK
jgi:hypothetical protein